MISTKSLTKRFQQKRVLDDVELTMKANERIALVGSNGAGKTTIIRCLLGEYTHEGEIAVNSLSPRRDRNKVLQRIGFVPQLPPPLKMPVGVLLGYAAGVFSTPKTNIEAIASRLGLDVKRLARQPFLKLSGGQKQKLLIAIALGHATDVLIMDEPAANLDPDARRVFFDLLAERANHVTMLISSHRLDEVATLVTRVIELDGGRILLDDRVADAPLAAVLSCKVTIRRADAAIEKALGEWGFEPENNNALEWKGVVSGADRLRFMGLMSRYVGLLTQVHFAERQDDEKCVHAVAS